MINIPVLDRLDVSGYGLFPGSDVVEPGLHIEFKPGLTLVIGANGLGKTTLITLIYRLLTGPFDIPALSIQSELGTASIQARQLGDRGMFARRVSDGARNAIGRLVFRLGTETVTVERKLFDLSLQHFSVDGSSLGNREDSFQSEIARRVGVWHFGDWILLLRHLVFYFEDRRALVWDASAQRQLLRLLFLPIDKARQWTEEERVILEMDSRMRNLNAALTKEQRVLATSEFKTKGADEARKRLTELEGVQETEQNTLETLNDQIGPLGVERQQLRFLTLEQEQESRLRELEKAQLVAIGGQFPTTSETARYILAQLLTDHTCLVCGSNTPEAAKEYEQRLAQGRCVVCGTDLSSTVAAQASVNISHEPVAQAAAHLRTVTVQIKEVHFSLERAKSEYKKHIAEIRRLNTSVEERSSEIDDLIRRLPPEEAELHKQRSELAVMKSRVAQLREDLIGLREKFRSFVDEVNRELVTQSENVKRSFDSYAQGFMLETCRLVWSTHRDRLGQTGEPFDFPAFELELTGTNFATPVRRSGPDEVSESQREFIDLAFRMALMKVAGIGNVGSLVIDAPESSLDAVFVGRATDVLSRFANTGPGNRLVVTSNLVEGGVLPGLLASAGTGEDRASRIVDLFIEAVPTAAVRELRAQYDQIRNELLGSGRA